VLLVFPDIAGFILFAPTITVANFVIVIMTVSKLDQESYLFVDTAR
jgi:hypothetical protein